MDALLSLWQEQVFGEDSATTHPPAIIKYGKVKIHFLKNGCFKMPARIEQNIFLPTDTKYKMWELANSTQFLWLPEKIDEYGVWFGGMDIIDNTPFLVRLTTRAALAFLNGGAKAFYDSLKPLHIKHLEQILGMPAFHQGDIFAMPLSCSFTELRRQFAFGILSHMFFGAGARHIRPERTYEETYVEKEHIFETRHTLTGTRTNKVLVTEFLDATAQVYSPMFLATGLLEAHNYPPLHLDEVHVLMQTANLYDPRQVE